MKFRRADLKNIVKPKFKGNKCILIRFKYKSICPTKEPLPPVANTLTILPKDSTKKWCQNGLKSLSICNWNFNFKFICEKKSRKFDTYSFFVFSSMIRNIQRRRVRTGQRLNRSGITKNCSITANYSITGRFTCKSTVFPCTLSMLAYRYQRYIASNQLSRSFVSPPLAPRLAECRSAAQLCLENCPKANITVEADKTSIDEHAGKASQQTSPPSSLAKHPCNRAAERHGCQHKRNTDSPEFSEQSWEEKHCKVKSTDCDWQVRTDLSISEHVKDEDETGASSKDAA